jgi:hypothetical protein
MNPFRALLCTGRTGKCCSCSIHNLSAMKIDWRIEDAGLQTNALLLRAQERNIFEMLSARSGLSFSTDSLHSTRQWQDQQRKGN